MSETGKSQIQLFYESHRRMAAINEMFMDFVNDPVDPLTREDLTKLIKHRPELYGRFSGFLDKLPSRQ